MARDKVGMDVDICTNSGSFSCSVPLIGPHQVDNIAVAISLVEAWIGRHGSHLPHSDTSKYIRTGLEGVVWPGRLERISKHPPVFIDVGHSPDACRRVAETVGACLTGVRILLVIGVSANKAVEEIVHTLVPSAASIICTQAYHHGESAERIAAHVRAVAANTPIIVAPTIEDAVRLARDVATAQHMTVLVAGGLFLAAEFAVAWKGAKPQSLLFL
jgi:dihydrofolate synthase/folylpolyglutamate synthase